MFGQASGCLGSHVVCSQATVVAMPSNVSFEEAATMPTVFITADIAFRHAISLQQKKKVLVHAAAGQFYLII